MKMFSEEAQMKIKFMIVVTIEVQGCGIHLEEIMVILALGDEDNETGADEVFEVN
jgi:hypothetical protein